MKSVSPSYDFSKSEVDGTVCTYPEGHSEHAAITTKDCSDNCERETKDDLPSQHEHLPHLTPLDFTKINICPTKSNQECIVTSVCTNPITQSQIVSNTGGSQKSTFSNSPHLGTPSSAGTPKTPSPRLRSLLNMAGYSSQDIQDATSPVCTTSQIRVHQDKITSVNTPSPSSNPVSTPFSTSLTVTTVTSSQPVKTSSSSVLNTFALRPVQV